MGPYILQSHPMLESPGSTVVPGSTFCETNELLKGDCKIVQTFCKCFLARESVKPHP